MLGFKLHYQIEPIGFADEYRVRGKENPVSGVWAVRFIVVPFAKVKESRFGSDADTCSCNQTIFPTCSL